MNELKETQTNTRKRILEIETPLGTLCAEVGGEPIAFPEIFVYIRRKDGVEIDLVCASADIVNEQINAFLYGDTTTECWTNKYTWDKKEIEVDIDDE